MYNVNKNLNLIDYLNSNYVLNKFNKKSILNYCYIVEEELKFWINWK